VRCVLQQGDRGYDTHDFMLDHTVDNYECILDDQRLTVLPPATSRIFQSMSTPLDLNISLASSAIFSNPPVASTKTVGPAPDKHMPKRPGWVEGDMDDVTSGKPGI